VNGTHAPAQTKVKEDCEGKIKKKWRGGQQRGKPKTANRQIPEKVVFVHKNNGDRGTGK